MVTWWHDHPIVAERGRLLFYDGNHTEALMPPRSVERMTALYTQDDTLFVGHTHGVHTLDLRSRRWGHTVAVANVSAIAFVPDTPLVAIAGQALGRCSPLCSWDVYGGTLHRWGPWQNGSITALSANRTHLYAVGSLSWNGHHHRVSVYTRGQWHTVNDDALPCVPHAVSAYGPYVATQCPDTQVFRFAEGFVPVPVPAGTRLTHLYAYAGEDAGPVVLAAGTLPHAHGTAPFAQLHEGTWHALASYVGPRKLRPVLGVGAVVGVSLALGLGTTFALVILSMAATLMVQVLRLAPSTATRSV